MLNAGVLTISDKGARGQRYDESGKVIKDNLSSAGGQVIKYEVIPDEAETISHKLTEWADEGDVDVIITTGGTGLSPRDNTPEATLSVIDKEVPGIAEAMRLRGLEFTPFAILSRAKSGIRDRTLIINLPGSPDGVKQSLQAILPAIPHAVEVLRGQAGECAHKKRAG